MITPLDIGILIYLSINIGFCIWLFGRIRDDIQSHMEDYEEDEDE